MPPSVGSIGPAFSRGASSGEAQAWELNVLWTRADFILGMNNSLDQH